MDDDDADYMQGSEDEDYGFDYSDGDEANQSGSADVDNMYYTAKCVFYFIIEVKAASDMGI